MNVTTAVKALDFHVNHPTGKRIAKIHNACLKIYNTYYNGHTQQYIYNFQYENF